VIELARILPGVEIKVVKEIVPQQLNPSGVVGVMGTSEKGPVLMPTPVNSYREFQDKFGSDPTQSLTREVRQAFLNGVFQVFVTRVEAAGSQNASSILKTTDGDNIIRIEAKAAGDAGNNIVVGVSKGSVAGTASIQITDGAVFEVFDNLSLDNASDNFIIDVLSSRSKLINATDIWKEPKTAKEAKPTKKDLSIGENHLIGGKTAQPQISDYEKALEMLEMEDDIDLVYAADCWDPKVHALIDAHCQNMSKDAKNRIGIGTVGPRETIEDIKKRTEVLASDRFVIVAPYGVSGAVAGLISYRPSELMELLKTGILPLEARRGRGIIVEKGITTSKEQISVMRVADHAVRGVKNVCENFIGTLNTAGGRTALREKMTEFLLTMSREEAIVPSTDGKEPAFIVDVYSSQLDFAQGIVRVDLAVRPVRAIDYIYATLTVQA